MSEYSTFIGFGILTFVSILSIIGSIVYKKINLSTPKEQRKIDTSFSVIICPNCSHPLADESNKAEWRLLQTGVHYFSANCPKCKIGLSIETQLGENQRVKIRQKR